ncbi:MAG: GNAT family N-acetyltransferase [Thermoplasmata archaeon]|nr:GNAT family N-acetyltransferase [Thermoplasmata archaeon]
MPEAPALAKSVSPRFRAATVEESSVVLALLSEAAGRMVAAGNEHGWPRPFPARMILEPLRRGDVYLVEQADSIVLGTLTLSWEDLPFWGPRPPDAGYVHRLAIRPRFAGRGWGRAALEWAAGQVAARERAFLRLDCASSNARLRAYYQGLGFRAVGEVAHHPLRFPVTLFERKVS